MQLKQIEIADYKDYPGNYNLHPSEQIEALKESIEMFGQVKNVVVWGDYFLAGHGFKTACLELGLEMLAAFDASEWDEDKAIAYLVADNETARQSIRDNRLLADLIDGLEKVEIPGVNEALLDELLRTKEWHDNNTVVNGDVVDDPLGEWEDMPEFEHQDMSPVKSLKINFATMEDYQKFTELIGQPLTKKTISIWYPQAKKGEGTYADKVYTNES